MPILIAGHYYVNKKPKGNYFINEILPLNDIEVSQRVFDSFKDCTRVKGIYVDDREEQRNIMADVLETTGAPA